MSQDTTDAASVVSIDEAGTLNYREPTSLHQPSTQNTTRSNSDILEVDDISISPNHHSPSHTPSHSQGLATLEGKVETKYIIQSPRNFVI